jgi:hypothetical protein
MTVLRDGLRAARAALTTWWAQLRGRLPRWLGGAPSKPPPYRTERADEVPDDPEGGVLYVVGEGAHEWYAVMRCPCGCGESLVMSLLTDARPRWRVTTDERGVPSLSPSVNRRVGCRSHFFLREGHIAWCERKPP